VLLSLALPIALSAVALFFASFVSWMVVQLHKKDWQKLPAEDDFMASAGKFQLPEGSYMFPMAASTAEMQTPEFQKKFDAGPRGILTILPRTNMGRNLGLTFLTFLAVSFAIGYLASMAFPKGTDFLTIFRFVFTAAFLAYSVAIVQHAIWFSVRVVGQLIESVVYGLICATLFAAMWPSG
jgi:hypothetical protein